MALHLVFVFVWQDVFTTSALEALKPQCSSACLSYNWKEIALVYSCIYVLVVMHYFASYLINMIRITYNVLYTYCLPAFVVHI
jgi:hypothetical protein